MQRSSKPQSKVDVLFELHDIGKFPLELYACKHSFQEGKRYVRYRYNAQGLRT